METTLAEYTEGDALDDLAVYWQADNGTWRNFSAGWTFEVKVGDANGVRFTKTTGITGQVGSATVPSIVVGWTNADLGALSTDRVIDLRCQVRAFSSGESLTKEGTIRLKPALT